MKELINYIYLYMRIVTYNVYASSKIGCCPQPMWQDELRHIV
jgi:hypothetical protein